MKRNSNLRKTYRLTAVILTLLLALTSASTMTFAAEDTPSSIDQDQITVNEDTDAVKAAEKQEQPAEESEVAIDQDSDISAESEAEETQSDPVVLDPEVSLFSEDVSRVQNTMADLQPTTGKTAAQLGITAVGQKLDKTYRTILIAGSDDGNRADMIIILSIPKKKNANGKIFTVARDTYMQLDSGKKHRIDDKAREFCKANRAYDIGGMYMLMRELNRHLDLNIRECVSVDWECAAKIVDKLNSMGYQITGNITSENMLNAINFLKPKEGDLEPVSGKYPQTVKLKGWQAVQYLRVRKYDNADPRVRDTRNRAMFLQLFKIGKKMTLAQAEEVFEHISGDLVTNMTDAKLRSALALIATADYEGDIKISTISDAKAFPANWKGLWDPDGHFNYCVPATLKSNTAAIHKSVYGNSKYAPSKTAANLNKRIETHRTKVLKTKRPTIANAVIKASNAKYNGKKHTPNFTVTIGGRLLQKDRDYKLISIKNNISVGKATIKIRSISEEYTSGYKTGSFKIYPTGTKILKVMAAKKGFKATWKRNAVKMKKKRITGYQIQYSRYSSFKKGNKIKTVKGYSKTSTTIKKLKQGKTYYVRVRTYTKIGKASYYSAWSKNMKVKTR